MSPGGSTLSSIAGIAEDERGFRAALFGGVDGVPYPLVVGRQTASRVGGSGIAGKKIGLATTAAEVDLALGALAAGGFHPGIAAIPVEGG